MSEQMSSGVLRDRRAHVQAHAPVDERRLPFGEAIERQPPQEPEASTTVELAGQRPQASGQRRQGEVVDGHVEHRGTCGFDLGQRRHQLVDLAGREPLDPALVALVVAAVTSNVGVFAQQDIFLNPKVRTSPPTQNSSWAFTCDGVGQGISMEVVNTADGGWLAIGCGLHPSLFTQLPIAPMAALPQGRRKLPRIILWERPLWERCLRRDRRSLSRRSRLN